MLDIALVDRLTAVKSKISELTAEKDRLEGEIILASREDLENTCSICWFIFSTSSR